MSAEGAADILARARGLVDHGGASTAGLWPRAAALVGRQALEQALRELWAQRAPGLERLTARAQLTCLPEVIRDRELAGEVAFSWSLLSDACHQRPYEVGLTAGELSAHFDVVQRLLDRLAVVAAR